MAAYIFEDVIKEIEQMIEKEELFLNGLDEETISISLCNQMRERIASNIDSESFFFSQLQEYSRTI